MKKFLLEIIEHLTLHHAKQGLSSSQIDYFRKEKYKWFFSSIIMGIFPFILLIVIGLMTKKSNLFDFIINGDLVLASFMIVPSLLLDFLETDKSKYSILLLASLNILLLISLVALYMIIKLSPIDQTPVIIVSLVTYILSLVFTNLTKNNILYIMCYEKGVVNSD